MKYLLLDKYATHQCLSPVESMCTSTLAAEVPVLVERILLSVYVGNFSPVTAMNQARSFMSSC